MRIVNDFIELEVDCTFCLSTLAITKNDLSYHKITGNFDFTCCKCGTNNRLVGHNIPPAWRTYIQGLSK
jgi:hypothetical protein